MVLSVNWSTQVVTVPQADLTLLSGTTYQHDMNAFRLDLKAVEASADGMANLDIHRHTTETVLSGVTYARFVEIINNYTVQYEDGQYGVNLVGANNNLLDVLVRNQVSVAAQNSAGLVSQDLILAILQADETLDAAGLYRAYRHGTGDELHRKQLVENPDGSKTFIETP